jgi:putative spermidine/putrescine transport system substrate-binding protein
MTSWTEQSWLPRRGLGAVALVIVLAGCGGGGGPSSTGPTGQQPPTAGMKPQSSIGAGEGALNLIAWEGYTDPSWVTPFEQQTGCKVTAKFGGSSDEMVSLMTGGGGGQYDMVSASGDADLRLIYGGDVKPVNVDLVPDWKNFESLFKSPPYNTINGVHYGISLQWGPNVLLYNKSTFSSAPSSWKVLYDSQYQGKITVPDNPIQIADAALYLMKTNSSLGITDPYELTRSQFDAAVKLLKQQRPLVKKYWALASEEISMFSNHDVVVGAAWPYQTNTLQANKVTVADTIPTEGATGWADTWMLATKAPHPNCAYMWYKWISSPKVQAQQAISFGETPVNSQACTEMDKLQADSCAQYHANAPASYFSTIKFWKTPLAACGNGKNDCVPYSDWVTAWTSIKS